MTSSVALKPKPPAPVSPRITEPSVPTALRAAAPELPGSRDAYTPVAAPGHGRQAANAAQPVQREQTARFDALYAELANATTPAAERALIAPEVQETLRNTVVVFVRGYLWRLYLFCLGRGYLHEHAAACMPYVKDVIVVNVGSCYTSAHNSRQIYDALAAYQGEHPEPFDVILSGHSLGTRTILEFLRNPDPAYGNLQARVEGIIPMSGVFNGSSAIDALMRVPFLAWLWDAIVTLFGGDRHGLTDMAEGTCRPYLAEHKERIAHVLERIAVVALVNTYRWPRWRPSVPRWRDLVGWILLPSRLYLSHGPGGEDNDGCCTKSTQIPPHGTYVVVDNVDHADSIDDNGHFRLRVAFLALLTMAIEARFSAKARRFP